MIRFKSVYLDNPPVDGRILDMFEGGNDDSPAIMFVHGGGWHSGSRAIFHQIALAFVAEGYDCASTDYRLSGVTLFDQVQDVCEALAAFAEDRRQRGRNSRILLIGSSAGAHLASLAALNESEADCGFEIAGLCLQSAPLTFEPWPDIFPGIWDAMQKAVGATYEQAPELYALASPARQITRNAPPIFLLHAGNEHMFPLALTEAFMARAAALGVPVKLSVYENMEHGFFYTLTRRQQQQALADILAFISSLP
jgi:acetyl esterase/lipase